MSGNKDIRAALPPGYSLRAGTKHLVVVDPGGNDVRHADGRRLIVSKGGKPNTRTLSNVLRELRSLM